MCLGPARAILARGLQWKVGSFSTDNVQGLVGVFAKWCLWDPAQLTYPGTDVNLSCFICVSFSEICKWWSSCMRQPQLVLCQSLCSGWRVMGSSRLAKLAQMLLPRGVLTPSPHWETSICREREWAGGVATPRPVPGPARNLAAQQLSQHHGAAAGMRGPEPGWKPTSFFPHHYPINIPSKNPLLKYSILQTFLAFLQKCALAFRCRRCSENKHSF